MGQVGTIRVFRTKGTSQSYLSSPSSGRCRLIKSKMRCTQGTCLPSSFTAFSGVGSTVFLLIQVNRFFVLQAFSCWFEPRYSAFPKQQDRQNYAICFDYIRRLNNSVAISLQLVIYLFPRSLYQLLFFPFSFPLYLM